MDLDQNDIINAGPERRFGTSVNNAAMGVDTLMAESRFSATESRLQRSALKRLRWVITQLGGRSTFDQDNQDGFAR